MKIPKKIKIGGYEFNIVDNKESFVHDTSVVDGTFDFQKSCIELSSTQDTPHANTVFLHEVCHAILEVYGPKISNEEEVVEQFSKGLYQFIVDNPEIFN